jgi:2',3'-cyclic-nucleotide 2'-phosphodiesterase (5'-nucleotidase family)
MVFGILATLVAALRQSFDWPPTPQIIAVLKRDVPAYYRIQESDLKRQVVLFKRVDDHILKQPAQIVQHYTLRQIAQEQPLSAMQDLGPVVEPSWLTRMTPLALVATTFEGQPQAGDVVDITLTPTEATASATTFKNVLILDVKPAITGQASSAASPQQQTIIVAIPLELRLDFVTKLPKAALTMTPKSSSSSQATPDTRKAVPAATPGQRAEPVSPRRRFVILAINDVYRIEGVDAGQRGGLARVRSLRTELEQQYPDLLLLHAGDFLFPSFLSRQFEGAQMIDVLNLLDGSPEAFDERMLVTFGNHEFDRHASQDAVLLHSRIKASQFRWLGSNIEFASGDDGRLLVDTDNLVNSVLLESGGVRVGVFSLTTDLQASAYVAAFGEPETIARHMTAQLRRQGAEVVVALTHLRMSQDAALLRHLGPEGPDLIIGGHEHNKQVRQVLGRWVIKADADARTAAVIHVFPTPGAPLQITYMFRALEAADPPPDPQVHTRVTEWLGRHDRDYCEHVLKREPGCLQTLLSRTQVPLIGEELAIRQYETNLGNWIADQARAAFSTYGVQVAFINAGSLRLNQNLPAGTSLTLRHVEEIFAYPMPLKLLRIPGRVLQQVVSHAVEDWTGNGWWLQISGFAYRHNPDTEPPTADRLTLLTLQGPRPIDPDEELLVVTNEFLVNPAQGQDGYTMLTPEHRVPYDGETMDLQQLVVKALQTSGVEGIAPQVEGRICNIQRAGPCLAVATDGK